MNIGIVCYASMGGSGIIATELGMALADLRSEIVDGLPSRRRYLAQQLYAYLDPDRVRYVHLMDGGIGDNLAMRAVVDVVVRALVDRPDEVHVTESVRRGMTVVELTTAPGDMGKIIGRQGRTAAALRTLVSLTAEQHGTRGQLDIRD